MTISRKSWENYIITLRDINEEAAEKLVKYLNAHDVFSGTVDAITVNSEELKPFIDYAYAIVSKYGEASASLAAEMYDLTAELEGVFLPPAELAPLAEYGDVARAINGTIKTSQNYDEIASAATRWVKMAASDTTLHNAQRDGAQFAWIPSGDTCAFCLTLASRGWQYMSKNAMKGGHAEHIHSNCDCQYTIRHDPSMTVEGYDPDKYLSMYRNAEGRTPQERINSMRREQYERDADERKPRTLGLSAGQANSRIPEHEPPSFIRELVDGEDRREVLLGYESQIADEAVENAIVITNDGRIYHCYGTLNGVYPDSDLGDELYGADMTHNHPIGSRNEYTFSSSDVNLFATYNLNTLRGIDERYTYELNHNPATLDSPTPFLELDEYSTQHEEMIDTAERRGYGYFRRRR